MDHVLDYPRLVFLISFIVLWCSVLLGVVVRKKWKPLDAEQRDDFGIVQSAMLTLLGLLIGFAFSMAMGRLDQRKNYEEAEANAIGTEYVRADLLPPADAAKVRKLLRIYLDQRILFYTAHNKRDLQQIDTTTTQLQGELWNATRDGASAQPTATTALAVWGMNDVLNSQGYTQAAWSYRIPTQAWILMIVIAICCSIMLGYGSRRNSRYLFLLLPFAIAISIFLIADVDSPRRGMTSVSPENLMSLSHTFTK